jgi:hypothetical protein
MVLTIALGIVLGFALLAALIWSVVFVARGLGWVSKGIKLMFGLIFSRAALAVVSLLLCLICILILPALALTIPSHVARPVLAIGFVLVIAGLSMWMHIEKKRIRRYRELHPKGWRQRWD